MGHYYILKWLYFISLHDAGILQHNVDFLYLSGDIPVLKRSTFIVSQGIQIPICLYALLYKSDKTLF